VQIGLAALLAVFLVGAVALSLPHADLANLHPFAPHGWKAIGPAAALLVWSFVGWEAVTHLTAEFRRPARDVPRATAIAVVVVGVLYLSVAFATITVLGPGAAETDAPLGDLLAIGLGGNSRILAACAALLLSFGAMNAYYAGASKLGAALARDGSLPKWLTQGSAAGEIPRRSLALLGGMSTVTALVVVAAGITPSSLVLLTTGLFVTVYAVGVAAAVKLLPRGSKARLAALVAQGAVVVLLLMAGPYLLWALIVTVAALLYRWLTRSQRRP
jgi:amino acid efflux transporter